MRHRRYRLSPVGCSMSDGWWATWDWNIWLLFKSAAVWSCPVLLSKTSRPLTLTGWPRVWHCDNWGVTSINILELVVQKFYRCRGSCLPVTQKLRFICRMSTWKEEENFIIDILQQNHQLFRNYINKKKETNYKEIQKSETTETGCIFWQCI